MCWPGTGQGPLRGSTPALYPTGRDHRRPHPTRGGRRPGAEGALGQTKAAAPVSAPSKSPTGRPNARPGPRRAPKGVRLGMSRRRAKSHARIARLHARIADLRRDALHPASTELVREAQVISIEALRVKALARGMGRRGFRRAIADAALGELRRQITYKDAWASREVVALDPFYPGSKTCSACGAVNAAKNLQAEGLRVLSAADAAQWATVVPYRRRPTANREPAQRPFSAATPARAETRRAP